MSTADWLTRWLSLLALAIALASFFRTRLVDRRNMFVDLHTRLMEPDMVKARRDLYHLESLDDVQALHESEPERMTHLVRLFALYDLLGLYAERGWVRRRDVLAEWSHSLQRSRSHAAHVLRWRADWDRLG